MTAALPTCGRRRTEESSGSNWRRADGRRMGVRRLSEGSMPMNMGDETVTGGERTERLMRLGTLSHPETPELAVEGSLLPF